MPFQPPPGAPPPVPPAGPPVHQTTLPPPGPGPASWAPPAGWGPPPVTVGSLLTRTLRVWWSNLGRLVGLNLVVLVPALVALGVALASGVNVAALFTPGRPPPPEVFRSLWLLVIGAFVVGVPLVALALGGLSYGTIRWLAGLPAGVFDMLGQGFRRLWKLVLATLLVWLVTTLGIFALCVPGLMFLAAAAATIPAVAVEGIGPLAAIERSMELTRGYRWTVFATALCLYLLNFVASFAGNVVQLASPVAGVVVNLVVSVLLTTLQYTLPAVTYHDLRVLKEGVDTTRLAQVFE